MAPRISCVNWLSRPGYFFGFSQPSVSFVLAIRNQPGLMDVHKVFESCLSNLAETAEETPEKDETDLHFIARRVAYWTAEIQRIQDIPVGYGILIRSMPSPDSGIIQMRMHMTTWVADTSRKALDWILALWNSLSEISPQSAPELSRSLRETLPNHAHGSRNYLGMALAIERNRINLIQMMGNVYCLGTGNRSRFVQSTTTDQTSVVSQILAQNKYITTNFFRKSGLPAPENTLVNSGDQAAQAATRIGYPVVVKPATLDRGQGVAADLINEAEVRAAYGVAAALCPLVLVEKHIPGSTHRLSIANGRLFHVRRRRAGGVVGDGQSTIADLVAAEQATARGQRFLALRGVPPIALDAEALSLLTRAGLTPDSILPAGSYQRLRRRDNVNAGGVTEDLDFNDIHPANLQLALAATSLLRLDIAGVDLIIEDISKPWYACGGTICEVNVRPQAAARRSPKDYDRLLESIVGNDPHVPAEIYLVGDEKTACDAVLRHLLAKYKKANIAFDGGIVLQGEVQHLPIKTAFAATHALAVRKEVNHIFCIMSLSAVVQTGLPLLRWNRIVIWNEALVKNQDKGLVSAVTAFVSGHGPVAVEGPAKQAQPAT